MAIKNKFVSPFLKWVGGKRQLLSLIVEHLPAGVQRLCHIEPFIGGGALLFHLQPKNAVINDINTELINVYHVIKNQIDELLDDLKRHENTADYFYRIRNLDRTAEFEQLTNVQRASRIIYLNKTCYNGLYRVNHAGEFNAPFGRYTKPNIINQPTLTAVHQFLNKNNIEICNKDYAEVLNRADKKSFVYLDPPYHPISENSNFTGYVQGGWNEDDQIRLKKTCDRLNDRGIKFLVSNSSALFIKELYAHYHIHVVKANRNVNSKGANRGEVEELFIKNYD